MIEIKGDNMREIKLVDIYTEDDIKRIIEEEMEHVIKNNSIDYFGVEQKVDRTNKEQIKRLAVFHLIPHFAISRNELEPMRCEIGRNARKISLVYDKCFDDIYEKCMKKREKSELTPQEYKKVKWTIISAINSAIGKRFVEVNGTRKEIDISSKKDIKMASEQVLMSQLLHGDNKENPLRKDTELVMQLFEEFFDQIYDECMIGQGKNQSIKEEISEQEKREINAKEGIEKYRDSDLTTKEYIMVKKMMEYAVGKILTNRKSETLDTVKTIQIRWN